MNRIITLLLISLPCLAFGQFGVGYYQSNLPFVGLNYEMKNKLRPEIRVGTDNYFEALSIEGVLAYDLLRKEDFALYAGVGVRLNSFTGVVIPLGINVYPLATKQFGFHIELSPILGEDALLRGSWGIRYRFKQKGG